MWLAAKLSVGAAVIGGPPPWMGAVGAQAPLVHALVAGPVMKC